MIEYFQSKQVEIISEDRLDEVDSFICLTRMKQNEKLVLMTRSSDKPDRWEPFYFRGIETGFWDTRKQPETDYDEVFKNYRELGANGCIFMLHWRDLEPEDGKFDFGFPDRIVAAARKNGVKVWFILFTHHEPKASEPDFWVYHLESVNGEDRAVQWAADENGKVFKTIEELRAQTPRVEIYPCYSNPAVFSRIIRVIRQFARYYRHSDTVVGLQIGNEEGYTYCEEKKTWDSDFNPYTLKFYDEWKQATGKSSWHAFKLWSVKWWWRQFTTAFHQEDPYKPTSFNFAGGHPEKGDAGWIHFEGVDATTYGEGNIDVVGSMFYGREAASIWENIDQHYDYIYNLPILIPSEIGLGPNWGQTAVAQQFVIDTIKRGAQGFCMYMYGEMVSEKSEFTAYGVKYKQWTHMLKACESILWSGIPGYGEVAVTSRTVGMEAGCLHSPDGSVVAILNFPEFFQKDDSCQELRHFDADILLEGIHDGKFAVTIYQDGELVREQDIALQEGEIVHFALPQTAESSLLFVKVRKLQTFLDFKGEFQVLVNQVGYDCKHSKKFIVQTKTGLSHKAGSFKLIDKESDRVAYSGGLTFWGRVNRDTPDDWGFDYWVGDFSEHTDEGTYELFVTVGDRTEKSYPFEIGERILWRKLAPAAFSYYKNARNCKENFDFSEKRLDKDWEPRSFQENGILEDDGRYYDVNGAWFEFGTYGGTFMRDAARVMLSVLESVEREPSNGKIRDELAWGATWWEKIMIHYPESGAIIAGMGGWHADNGKVAWYDYPFGLHEYFKFYSLLIYARLYELTREEKFLKQGELMWEYYHQWVDTDKVFSLYYSTGKSQEEDGINYKASWKEPGFNYTKVDDAAFLFGDVALYMATGNKRYLEHAEKLVDNILSEVEDKDSFFKYWNNNYSHDNPSALAYFVQKLPDHPKAGLIKSRLEAFLDAMIEESEASPFGIARKNFIYYETWNPEGRKPDSTRSFFNRSEEGKGVNPEYGLEIWQSLLINSVVPKKKYVDFALNHIHWILGLNPRNVCMMKGVGSHNPRIKPGGSLNGCICHGLIADHEHDRPWMGVWMDESLDWHKDSLAGYKIWAQGESLIRGTACFMMGLALLD